MPSLFRRKPQDLPQHEETWHTFSFKLRTWVEEKKDKPMRPYGLMVLDLDSRFMMGIDMNSTLTPEWVSESLLKAMTHPTQGMQPHRPRTITLPDADLVAALGPRLAAIGVACQQMDTPEDMYDIVAELEKHLNRGQPEIGGLLSVEGVTPGVVGEVFAAAIEFYRAAAWIKLTNSQALAVRLANEAEPRYVSVMGNAGIEYGLSVSMTWDDFSKLASGAGDDPMDFIPEQGGHSFLFNAMTEVSFDDLDGIEKYHWPILDENTIPFPMVFDRKGGVARPDRAELLWYQAALRAIPIFVRENLRSGQPGDYAPAEASIVVPTSDGETAVVIHYPAGELDIASEPAAEVDWGGFEAEAGDDVAVFDRRMMEGQMAAMAGSLGGQSFLDDPQLHKAQETMYKAWEEKNPAKRISLAHTALKRSSDCADAYVLLAQEEADTVGRALELYQQGVAAGERALGPHLGNLVGEFWGVLETRPYMRARLGVAETLWRLGRREEARAHFEDMLRLNPSDNQGVRYLLVNLLLELDRDADVRKLLNKYRSEWSAYWKYSQALIEFRKSGDTDKANKALKSALRQNPHVSPYLTGQKRMPNNKPNYIGMGDENEAIAYAADHLNHWRRTEGAVDWLKAQLATQSAALSAKKAKEPSFDDIIESLVAEMAGPMALDKVVKLALERKPSKAKNPVNATKSKLRQNYGRGPFVFLDRDTVMPIRLAMKDVRFRITLDRQMASACAVQLDPYFYPFLRGARTFKAAVECSFTSDQGQEIPADLTTVHVKGPELLGESMDSDVPGLDFKEWLGPLRPRRGDSLLLTVLDWNQGRFQIVYEPERRRRKKEITAQNRALADMLYELLEETYDERLWASIGLPTAYARLTSARDYPGDHWLTVIERDERMTYRGDFEITHADSDRGSLFETFAQEPGEDAVEEKPFTAQQGRQVYRFRAVRGKKEFTVEVQGNTTLGDFDAVMKEAFKLDTWDHLSEFTLITPRGKGKQPRLKHFGSMDPLGEYAAHHVRLAGLGLEQGALLEYVYDFGDNIEHSLVLEAMGEPEKGVEYPRFHKVAGSTRGK